MAYFGNHVERPADEHAVTANPRLVNPRQTGDGISSANGFKLRPNSAYLGKGKVSQYNNVEDFLGNIYPASELPSIGAHNP